MKLLLLTKETFVPATRVEVLPPEWVRRKTGRHRAGTRHDEGAGADRVRRDGEEAADFGLMALLQVACAAGFGIAAAGSGMTGNFPVCGAAGGFALLCAVLAARNFQVWRGGR
jgi:hypothetical protein